LRAVPTWSRAPGIEAPSRICSAGLLRDWRLHLRGGVMNKNYFCRRVLPQQWMLPHASGENRTIVVSPSSPLKNPRRRHAPAFWPSSALYSEATLPPLAVERLRLRFRALIWAKTPAPGSTRVFQRTASGTAIREVDAAARKPPPRCGHSHTKPCSTSSIESGGRAETSAGRDPHPDRGYIDERHRSMIAGRDGSRRRRARTTIANGRFIQAISQSVIMRAKLPA